MAIGRRIGLITFQGQPDLSIDDRFLLEPLTRQGFAPFPVVWSQTDPSQLDADLLVMRSAWDYYLTPGPFLEWLSAIERSGVRMFNPVATIRWNMRKEYLLRLRDEGIAIPRTAVCRTWDPSQLRPFLGRAVVLKPVVSASAHDTFRYLDWDLDSMEAAIGPLLVKGPVLVQEYIEEVERSGEWSFVFLGRTFSHAVLKTAAHQDFRVQESLGGSTVLASADRDILRQASDVLDRIKDEILYARVDGVVRGGAFLLMELELFEPSLFLRFHPPAAERFAETLRRMTDDHAERR